MWRLCPIFAAFVVLTAMPARPHARQVADAPQATFRTSIDVTTLDVSVLDKDRRPVRGLTAEDFTVLERGKPLTVRAFTQVDIPPRGTPNASWVRDVAPDVVDNAPPTGRVLAIVIDDASIACCSDARGMAKARAIMSAALDELGPEDVAAVTATMINHAAQGFTKDRQLLRASARDAALAPGAKDDLYRSGMCYCGVCASEALERVTEALLSIPGRRKTLMFVSAGYPLDVAITDEATSGLPPAFSSLQGGCGTAILRHTIQTLRNAALANIAIQAIDPNGLCTTGVASSRTASGSECNSHGNTLRVLAETTGGRVVTLNNEPDREVPAIFDESSTYYLLSVDSSQAAADGHFHPIEVHVNRSGVDVRTRSGYYAPTDKERNVLGASNPAADAGVIARADLPLKVAAAPFLGANGRPVIATVLSVADPVVMSDADPREELIEITTSAFEPENGKSFGATTQRVKLVRTAGGVTNGEIEVLSPFVVNPGRYDLRISTKVGDGRTASVYSYAAVPDFAKERLSLSGLVLSADRTLPAAPADAFAAFLPVRPTTRRTFRIGDHVGAFVRIYQAADKTPSPVTIASRVVNATDARVDGETVHYAAERFGDARAADYTYALPIDRLEPGEFLLEVTAKIGERTVTRALRFTVE